MSVIPFRPRSDTNKPKASHVVETGRLKPNFEDPHSRDFPEEPRDTKPRVGAFLPKGDVMALTKFRFDNHMDAVFGESSVSLVRNIRADLAGIETLNGELFITQPVAEIFAEKSKQGDLQYSYVLAQTQERVESPSFSGLLATLKRHLDTGYASEPEPDFFR